MVAGSTGLAYGTRATGHWSDWFTGQFNTGSPDVTASDGIRRIAGAVLERGTTEVDVMPYLATARDIAVTNPNSQYGAVSASSLQVTKDSFLYTNSFVAGDANFVVPMATVDASPVMLRKSEFPDYLHDKQYGVDYLPPPNFELDEYMVQYEGGLEALGTLVEWHDWSISGRYFYHGGGVQSVPFHVDGLKTPVTFRLVKYEEDEPSWPLAESFEVIDTFDLPIASPVSYDSTDFPWSRTVDLNPVVGDDIRWTVSLLPPFIDPTEDSELFDFPSPTGSYERLYYLHASMSINTLSPASLGVGASVNFGHTYRCFTTSLPELTAQQPRWRYWIPGPPPPYIPLGSLTINDLKRPNIIFW